MKSLLVILMLCVQLAMAQSFTAETSDIYVGESNTEFYGSINILSGTLKKSDKLAIYAETGRKFSATITKMSLLDQPKKEVNEVQSGNVAFIEFKTTDDATTGKDYLRKGYKVYPYTFNPVEKSAPSTSTTSKGNFSCTLDGKPFTAKVAYKGASLFRKGVKNYTEKPYLQLQFSSTMSPDDRVLTIQIFNPKEAPFTYTVKDMEVNFSGATDGKADHTTLFGFVNGKGDTDFKVDITKWQTGADKATISGKVSGKLNEIKLLGTARSYNTFENGTFENIEVELIKNQPDLKQMMKEAGAKF